MTGKPGDVAETKAAVERAAAIEDNADAIDRRGGEDAATTPADEAESEAHLS